MYKTCVTFLPFRDRIRVCEHIKLCIFGEYFRTVLRILVFTNISVFIFIISYSIFLYTKIRDRGNIEEPLCEKFPALFQLERYKNVLIKERVVDGPNGLELKFLWIRLPSVAAEISELNILSDAIVRYEFGLGAYKWDWILDSSGRFSVSSVKEKTQRLMFSDLRLDFEWNNWSPIKVNFLVWRLIQDKLPTNAALNRRNVIIEDNRCKMCGDEEESAFHLFASCRIAEQIWEFITRWCRIKQVPVLELKDLANIHKCNRGSHRWKKTVNLVTQATIWVIWRSRNEAVFEGKQPYVNRMKEEIKMFGYMWLKSRVKALIFHGITGVISI
ncbi:putative reverse transcriptase zinc-binding domain-containing protein [Helianthus annuus]|nr:putative reverse transcriptase zinc-binding domain-containing protein [Helianthus annuus]